MTCIISTQAEVKKVQKQQPRRASGSQQKKVAEKNSFSVPNPKENYKHLGKMVDQFGKKKRKNCKKVSKIIYRRFKKNWFR